MIGIVGGVGPRAGLDVFEKIIEETPARTDQEHLPVLLYSLPARIPDRTAFLSGQQQENPAAPLSKIILDLEKAGANVAGIPCNTAHADPIFSMITQDLRQNGSRIKLLHMIEEVADHILREFPARPVGVLSTKGTAISGVYRTAFEKKQLETVEPDEEWQERIHRAIYDETYGIKANSSPVSQKAVAEIKAALVHLKKKGAEAFILGCTELPLAFAEERFDGLPLIDPNRVLARSLIREYKKVHNFN